MFQAGSILTRLSDEKYGKNQKTRPHNQHIKLHPIAWRRPKSRTRRSVLLMILQGEQEDILLRMHRCNNKALLEAIGTRHHTPQIQEVIIRTKPHNNHIRWPMVYKVHLFRTLPVEQWKQTRLPGLCSQGPLTHLPQ